MFEALGVAVAVALLSLIGVFFFGSNKRLIGAERYVVPVAVGVFLSLVLYELLPETIEASPAWGGVVVAFGFIAFYVFGNILHQRFHCHEKENCDRKSSAVLLFFGDAIHNLADGFILGAAFLIDPAVGVATGIGLAIHEIPQEIVEFGVFIRGGFSRTKAALYNLISASTIVLGTLIIMLVAEHGEEYVWILTGIAAGNLLFIAASELLPRIHGNLKNYGSIWHATASIVLGFILMTSVLFWTHEYYGHGNVHVEGDTEQFEIDSHYRDESDHMH